jgi:hypothetical protein
VLQAAVTTSNNNGDCIIITIIALSDLRQGY